MTSNSYQPKRPLEIVKELRGIVHCFYLDKELVEKLKEEEAKVKAIGGSVDVANTGFAEALDREHIICVIKDPRFRPPPEATVVLLDEEGNMLGTEVFPYTAKEYESREDVVWLSESFVMFPSVKGVGREIFVLPPVSFPELNEEIGCYNVLSCSPAPTSDLLIKNHYEYKDDPRLASIIIAFDYISQE
ncbi:MAG TPA: hypothetical protein VJX93_01415 [Candidatus Methanomethylophilaceae archaeon]|nr:hypothetical protein [Candidatus Methanomethylophilaceae archaeon]